MKKSKKEEVLSLSVVRDIFKGAYGRYFQEQYKREGLIFGSVGNIGISKKEELLIMKSIRGKVLNLLPYINEKIEELLFNELEKDVDLKAQKKAGIFFDENEINIIREICLYEKENIKKIPHFYRDFFHFSDIDKKIKDKAMLKLVEKIDTESFTLNVAFEKIFEIISSNDAVVKIDC